MIQKFAVLTSLMLTASCTILHQAQIPVLFSLQYDDSPNYSFAYEVNDAHTGDIKSQHESRRGDTVLGQYTLVQPDGIQRTVEYRADDLSGFQATVNNEGRPTNAPAPSTSENNEEVIGQPNLGSNLVNMVDERAAPFYQGWPAPTSSQPTPIPTDPVPVAISRSSFSQTISHGPVVPRPN